MEGIMRGGKENGREIYIYLNKNEANKQFRWKLSCDVSRNRNLFWNEVGGRHGGEG